MKPTLIFDLDNTLVECGQYYLDASDEFAAYQADRTGCTIQFALDLCGVIDLEMAKRPGGFRRDRFPTSFKATSYALDAIAGLLPNPDAGKISYWIGDEVFRAPYTPYDGVFETLDYYANGGWQLVLLTKGDAEVQTRKINMHGFDRWFPTEQQFITLSKNPEYLHRVMRAVNATPSHTWVIGDSIRDDIGPALEVGVGAVEVNTGTGKWGYESAKHVADYMVRSVSAIQGFIPQRPSDPEAGHGKQFLSESGKDLAQAA